MARPPGAIVRNVMALGPTGAGKTVFMAAMYRHLRIRRKGVDFFLKSDYASTVHLNEIFRMVTNPEEDWPKSTLRPSTWEFTVTVTTPKGDFEPLRFRYLDYPGGLLTNPRMAQLAEYEEAVSLLKSAHAFLVLLDGQRILACLRGEDSGRRFLDFEISSSLDLVQQCRCPVHFAVTKWDLLEGGHRLREVRELLMGDENFRDTVKARQGTLAGPIRLIPVSSVGSGFAELQPDGTMRKLGKPARPFQVELPFVSVIPDYLTMVVEELNAHEQELLTRIDRQRRYEDMITPSLVAVREVVRRVVVPQLRRRLQARNSPLLALLPDDPSRFFEELLVFADLGIKRRQEQIDRQRHVAAEAVAGVHDQRSALELVVTQFQDAIAMFEQAHPESLLI